jgi:hypothetical protein
MQRRDFITCVCLGTAIARSDSSDNTLYMLTYDHGGVVNWGMDHFMQYLRSAAEWYPGCRALSEGTRAAG